MIIASRLPPQHTKKTWFSSGRAAFAFLVKEVVRPSTVYLPSFVCWSLIDTLRERFPGVQLRFYPVLRDLTCQYPEDAEPNSACVFIHYFGRINDASGIGAELTLLEDRSHVPLSTNLTPHNDVRDRHIFGSLRKAYRVADGGFLDGFFNPIYEADRNLPAWLRHEADDWRDMREAENMTDRAWTVSDISSQSLAVILQTNITAMRTQRHLNDRLLKKHFPIGSPVMDFTEEECPLLHNRLCESPKERDSLRSFMAARGVYTSIHWPVHNYLMQRRDSIDCEDAIWLQDHILSLPIAECLEAEQMETICNAAHEWARAGAQRFVPTERHIAVTANR